MKRLDTSTRRILEESAEFEWWDSILIPASVGFDLRKNRCAIRVEYSWD